ncbi:MAG TPA: hypothetical protein VN625_08495 [Desulfuromonadaceae bacterium]|nr:hypothetical protein [Desulfuromonadaceae bacterium]
MNIKNLQVFAAVLAITIASAGRAAIAQEIPLDAVTLSYGVPEVLQLAQARLSDDVIVRYVQNSGTIYALSAPEIVYLKQQGVSDTVLSAMIDQRKRLTGSTEPATAPVDAQTTATSNPLLIQPINNYYVTRPESSMVYVMPDTQTHRYDHWYSEQPYAFRAGYGNGFYEWPYACSSVVVIGTGYRRADNNYHVYEHTVVRH